MTQKYPEVMQTDENGIQNLPGKGIIFVTRLLL